MNEFFLLVLGLAGCWAIGALNKNVRLGLYLLAAMLTGFVGGAVYSSLHGEKSSDKTIVISNVVNGSEESTILYYNSLQEFNMSNSGVLSKATWSSDTQQNGKSIHQPNMVWEQGLSPPTLNDSS